LSLNRVIALVLVFAAGCVRTGPSDYDYSTEPDPRTGEYVIGVADTLAINVWRNEEISSDVKVRPDGTVTLPLLGDVQAAGKTPSELRTEIKKRLGQFLRDDTAIVTVAVSDVNSYRFTVSGEVANSGVFSTKHYITVVDAIALAGGFTRYAERERVMILRRDGKQGQVRKIPVDFRMLSSGEHSDMNLALMPGDTVVVP
jgi:polysaccharide biosynthesis/export protein